MSAGGRILLVEDEPPLRAALAQALDLAGFSVEAEGSAEAALDRVDGDWPGAVVSDVRLPGMDGISLLNGLRRMDPQIPVVLITGHGDIAMAVDAMRRGAYDFIEKPFAPERLIEAAGRAVEKRGLVLENRRLRGGVGRDAALAAIIGRAPAVERLRTTIAAVADAQADVLVIGETGTGKEMVARALHGAGARRDGPFVALNCGAIPETMVESELFGHEAGAFTGAMKKRVGRIAHAHRGTLFLDEVESMPPALQVKLLRVLQERVVEPLGGNELVPVDVRVVAATKVDLRQAADAGRFREDLYYRLNVVTLRIPPLRERRGDIPLLFQSFALQAAERYGREARRPEPAHFQALLAHTWPGNVRELRAAAERFVLGLDEALLGEAGVAPQSLADQVDAFEKAAIAHALAAHKGDLKAVLDALGLPRKTFYDKLRRHGLSRADFGE